MIQMIQTITPEPGFHTALLNDFFLELKHQRCLDSYYILHWQSGHLIKVMDKINLIIEHAGVSYIPVFKIDPSLPSEQLRLSFRKTKEELSMQNYVLIKAL